MRFVKVFIISIVVLMASGSLDIALSQELYFVEGRDMGAKYNHVSLWTSSATVEDATVTINGEAAPFST